MIFGTQENEEADVVSHFDYTIVCVRFGVLDHTV